MNVKESIGDSLVIHHVKFILSCLTCIVLSYSTLVAQRGWQVSPMVFNLNVDNGDTLTQFFTVNNKAEEAQDFMVYAKDWNFNTDGSIPEFEPGSLGRGSAGWVMVAPQNFTIKPKMSQTVRFTMVVPDTDLSGSYWSALFVETDDKPTLASKMENEGRSLSIFVKIRAKILINVTLSGDLTRDGEIANLEVELNSSQTSLALKSTFLNTGNMTLKCNGTVEIRDEMGEPIESFPLPSFTSLPGYERVAVTTHATDLEPGEYSAMVVIDFGGDYLVAGEAFFEITGEKFE